MIFTMQELEDIKAAHSAAYPNTKTKQVLYSAGWTPYYHEVIKRIIYEKLCDTDYKTSYVWRIEVHKNTEYPEYSAQVALLQKQGLVI